MIFVDGLGIGSADPAENPLAAYPDLFPTAQTERLRPGLAWKALDAALGVEGLPQSATGQTALLTGVNAPRLLGRHLQGFPSQRLIEILREKSIFVRLVQCGLRGTFANAYRHPEDSGSASRLSVTSHALKASGQPFRSLDQLRRREALVHDFTNQILREQGYSDIPVFSPEEAAGILVRIARNYHFTLYEHFLTDVLGHRGTPAQIQAHAALLHRFLNAAIEDADAAKITAIITSDHGNFEDIRVKTHTRNPVPYMESNAGDPLGGDDLPEDITGVTPRILRRLACSSPDEAQTERK
jgi:hypothetical protein